MAASSTPNRFWSNPVVRFVSAPFRWIAKQLSTLWSKFTRQNTPIETRSPLINETEEVSNQNTSQSTKSNPDIPEQNIPATHIDKVETAELTSPSAGVKKNAAQTPMSIQFSKSTMNAEEPLKTSELYEKLVEEIETLRQSAVSSYNTLPNDKKTEVQLRACNAIQKEIDNFGDDLEKRKDPDSDWEWQEYNFDWDEREAKKTCSELQNFISSLKTKVQNFKDSCKGGSVEKPHTP